MQDDLIKKLHVRNWLLLLLLGSFSSVFMPISFSLGVLAGGLIVTVGFHSLQKILERTLNPSRATSGVVFAEYYLRLTAMGIVISVLIFKHYVDALGLLLGLSIVVINLMLTAFNQLAKTLLKQGV